MSSTTSRCIQPAVEKFCQTFTKVCRRRRFYPLFLDGQEDYTLVSCYFIYIILPFLLIAISANIGNCHYHCDEGDNDVKIIDKIYSRKGTIIVEQRIESGKADGVRDVWLYYKDNPSKKNFLYSHERYVELIFSPDMRWLVINDYSGSNTTTPLLFKRQKGLKYREAKNIDIEKEVRALFVRLHKKYAEADSAIYSHLIAIQWAGDSKSFLVSMGLAAINDEDGTSQGVDHWLCVFDLRTRNASTNLAIMNRNSYTTYNNRK